ncbi:TPA: hypothetical protein IFJ06_005245, partial [Escherichia coli]|nr:hypothetical protein [Escherichia coli]HAN4924067.1 hypothetical protein [Escherichia coli]
KTVWQPGQTSLWGLALSLPADTDYPDPRGELDPEADPGLLYAGQWQDAESGLCYNRFRYYDPETGMYLVSDPLGLQGGEQTYRYVPNPCGYVDPSGLAMTSKIVNKLPSAKDLATKRASELLAKATSNTQRSKLPRAVSAVVDKRTGKIYYGESGWPHPTEIHPTLQNNMPSASKERWAIENCAEFKAVNEALKANAKISDLEVHTVLVKTGEAFPMCKNCQISIFGAVVTSG